MWKAPKRFRTLVRLLALNEADNHQILHDQANLRLLNFFAILETFVSYCKSEKLDIRGSEQPKDYVEIVCDLDDSS